MVRDAHRPLRLLLAVLALLPIRAQCGAPFQTDDPAIVEFQHIELLVFYQSTLGAEARTGTLPGLEAHFGIFEKVEFDVVAPLAFNTPSGGSTQRGYGDTELGIKYALLQESDAVPLISALPKVILPSGNSGRGLGSGGSQVFLALAAQKSWGDFQTYVNAGYWINNGLDSRDYWFVGWQGQYQFSDHLVLGAEIFHTTAQVVGEPSSTGFNVGGYYIFDPHNQLLFTIGRGLQNAAETNRVSAYFGYQISF